MVQFIRGILADNNVCSSMSVMIYNQVSHDVFLVILKPYNRLLTFQNVERRGDIDQHVLSPTKNSWQMFG